jgi:hypothetical protein
MGIGLLFWILWIIGLIFGFGWGWKGSNGAYGGIGSGLLVWIMIGLLGWAQWGPPIHN